MRRHRLLAAVLTAAALAAIGTGAATSSASPSHKTTLKYYFKSIGEEFKSPSGANVSGNAAPAVGDYFSQSIDAYSGTSKHHARRQSASAAITCVVIDVVSSSDIPGLCQGEIAIGGSLLLSTSEQNIANNLSNVPITGGTGIYKHAKGTVKTKGVGKTNNSNAVITFTR